jgi:hypothetical protein
MRRKAIAVFAPVAAILALGLFFGAYWQRHGIFPKGPQVTTTTILRQVQTLSQLVTVKYVLEKIVDVQDAKWYGENHVLLAACGVVKAGVNLDHLGAGDLEISGGKITLTLPHPVITDIYLDDRHTQVVERSTGLMRSFDKDLEQNTRVQALDDLRTLALDNGILKDAQDRAKEELAGLLLQLGFEDVEIKTR